MQAVQVKMPMRSGRTGHFNYPLPGLGYRVAAALLLFFTAFSAVAAAQTPWCNVEYDGQLHQGRLEDGEYVPWTHYTLDARYEDCTRLPSQPGRTRYHLRARRSVSTLLLPTARRLLGATPRVKICCKDDTVHKWAPGGCATTTTTQRRWQWQWNGTVTVT